MSSPAAGKFQDHYEVLGVDHKSGTDAIQAAYSRLSDKYHPKAGTAPDAEKYDAVTLAFEVLSDPDLRRDFDKLKGIGGQEKPKFSGASFFEAYGRDINLRVALLCVLYDRRRTKPFTPSLSMRNLEAILSASSEELNFALWYLKQRELVTMDDKSSLLITPDGMDYLKQNPPEPSEVMQLIRRNAVAGAGESDDEPDDQLLELAKAVEAAEEKSVPAEPIAATVGVPTAPASSATNAAARIGSLLAKRNHN